jgi:hypothetical protein
MKKKKKAAAELAASKKHSKEIKLLPQVQQIFYNYSIKTGLHGYPVRMIT